MSNLANHENDRPQSSGEFDDVFFTAERNVYELEDDFYFEPRKRSPTWYAPSPGVGRKGELRPTAGFKI
ncbi:hypothetical protein [Rhizobium sp. GCM10022189]|uniref:hypothetical protein n=1 Tax=Rhizobium sp. GCM10022189 TaxID=3252654 RepID=UPI00361DB159